MIRTAEVTTDGVVLRVINADSVAWCRETFGGVWIETSVTGSFRKNFAGIGFTYDATRDAFIPPKPYPSWVLNEATCRWEAPVPMPPGGPWVWDESTESWIDPELHD